MFTYFTDRDGKYQLGTLKESAFDPLSRTCEFMLKEEAHHMFVGTTGVDRVVARTAELMREHDTEDIAPHGGIPLDVIQKYVNFHYSVSLDLFGSEKSTNAANYFTAGLKGRWQEERRKDDHVLTEDGRARRDDPRRRDHHRGGLGADRAQPRPAHRVRRRLPDRHEAVEPGAGERRDRPAARRCRTSGSTGRSGCSRATTSRPRASSSARTCGRRNRDRWLPTEADKTHVRSLMRPVYEPGKMASWIAPPMKGINDKPVDYEYVHLA